MTAPDDVRDTGSAAPPDAPSSASADGAAGRSGFGGALTVATVAALCVLAVLLGYLAFEVRERARADTARTEALETARDAARLLFSYDHTKLDEDFAAGLELTTGEFREEYQRTTQEVVRPVAEQYDAVVEAEVVDAAVVQASPDQVTALVYVNQTTTSTRVEGPKIDQSRVRMQLVKDGDEWLVSSVDAL